MQIKIGDKIRELRRRDGRKQEDLATALGVTSQAVSRWEANGGYPDLEMIPAIANYFHVSTDELFGYHGDREEKIKAIIDRADSDMCAMGNLLAKDNGDLTECVKMLRAASEEFPNEPEILLKLGDALHMLGWQKYGGRACFKDGSDYVYDDTEYHSQNIYWREALSVYEKLMKMDITAGQRGTAVFTMVVILKRVGEYEKAKALVDKQDSVNFCKEVLMPRTAEGEEMDRYQGESIIALLQQFYNVIFQAITAKIPVYTAEYGRSMLLSIVNLFETVFIDGRFGSQHENMRTLYLHLAEYEARYGGDIKKALEYFCKGFEHHKAYCSICDAEEYGYSAPLVSKVTVSGKKLHPVSKDFWKIRGVPEELCGELRKKPKYAECFE